MPNHDENHVILIGPKALLDEAYAAIVKIEDGATRIDFNGVVAMPEEIRNTTSPHEVVATQDEADAKNGTQSPGTRVITMAESARRMQEYGAADWYDWSNKHWGTKWGAYGNQSAEWVTLNDYYDTEHKEALRLEFTTAWCAPVPWFEAIEAKWEGVEVHAITLDEDSGTDPQVYGDGYQFMYVEREVRWAD